MTPDVGTQLWPRTCLPPSTAECDLTTELKHSYPLPKMRQLLRVLKGLPKSAPLPQDPSELMRQTLEAMRAFALESSQQPERLLARLDDVEQRGVRDLLTAREHTLCFDKAFAKAVLPQLSGELEAVLGRLEDKGMLVRLLPITGGERYLWAPFTHAPIVRTWAVQQRDAPSVFIQATPLPEAMERVLTAVQREPVFFRALILPNLSQRTRSALGLGGWEVDPQDATLGTLSNGVRVVLLSPLTKESLRLLEQRTGCSEAQCEFLISLAYTLGLVEPRRNDQPEPQRITVNLTEVERWFGSSPEQQWVRAWQSWVLHNADWFEARQAIAALPFNRSFSIVRDPDTDDLVPATLAYELHGLRAYLARVLRGLPQDSWVYWPELAEQLFQFYPRCAWSVFSSSEWWFATPNGQTPIDVTQREGWLRTIGSIFAQMLRGPLLWLGVVEVGAANGSSAFSFRVTPLGRALLEGAPAPTVAALLNTAAPSPPDSVVWVDAYTVRLPSSVAWNMLVAQTRLWTEPGQETHTYLFTLGSIAAALRANRDAQALRAAYALAGSALSPEVEALLAEVARRRERVRIYETMSVVQLADEATAREVLAHSAILQQAYPLSPTAFALSPQAAEALVHELRQKGYLPLVES